VGLCSYYLPRPCSGACFLGAFYVGGAVAGSRKTVLFAVVLAAAAVAAAVQHLLPPHGATSGGAAGGCPGAGRVRIRAYLCVAAREAWERIIRGFEEEYCVDVDPGLEGARGSVHPSCYVCA